MHRGDLVLDLGAGTGALTAPLLAAGANVVAVERDAALAARLRRRFRCDEVTVVEHDLLTFALPRRAYRVVASIPFSITTPLLGRLLDPSDSSLQRAVVVLEWGAARRISAAAPADARILWWSARYELRSTRRIPAQDFSPPPRIDGGILIATRRAQPLVPQCHQPPFARLLTTACHSRGAPIGEALAPIFSRRQLRRLVSELRLDPQMATGRLDVKQWATINAAMVTLVDPARWPRGKPRWSTARARQPSTT